MISIDKILGCLQTSTARSAPQAGMDENKLQVSEHKIQWVFFFPTALKKSLF